MTVKEFMNENYEELSLASKRISKNHHLSEELLHYTIDEFLRKPNVEEIINSGGGRFYCVRILMNSWNSTTSPFYNTYRRTVDSLEEEHEDIEEKEELDLVELASKVKEELDKLHWYDKALFETYVKESHTISSLSRATGIPRTSVSLTINRIKKHLKYQLNGKI